MPVALGPGVVPAGDGFVQWRCSVVTRSLLSYRLVGAVSRGVFWRADAVLHAARAYALALSCTSTPPQSPSSFIVQVPLVSPLLDIDTGIARRFFRFPFPPIRLPSPTYAECLRHGGLLRSGFGLVGGASRQSVALSRR